MVNYVMPKTEDPSDSSDSDGSTSTWIWIVVIIIIVAIIILIAWLLYRHHKSKKTKEAVMTYGPGSNMGNEGYVTLKPSSQTNS
jgi:heme/copper-type cytochrome/quinol oxidase subunit 2